MKNSIKVLGVIGLVLGLTLVSFNIGYERGDAVASKEWVSACYDRIAQLDPCFINEPPNDDYSGNFDDGPAIQAAIDHGCKKITFSAGLHHVYKVAE